MVYSANSPLTSFLYTNKLTVKDTVMLSFVSGVGTYEESLKGICACGLLKVCPQEKGKKERRIGWVRVKLNNITSINQRPALAWLHRGLWNCTAELIPSWGKGPGLLYPPLKSVTGYRLPGMQGGWYITRQGDSCLTENNYPERGAAVRCQQPELAAAGRWENYQVKGSGRSNNISSSTIPLILIFP